MLQTVAESRSFEENLRGAAKGLHSSFQTKQIVATACPFRESFALTETESDKAEDLESSDGEDDDADKEYVDADEKCGDVKVFDEKKDSTDNLPLNKMSIGKKDIKKIPSFIVALKYLSYPEYHLVDAYLTLCQGFAIAVAIPISSTSTEQSFSALKKVKTRIRSTMVQD